jgi:hypothetical protein
MAATRITINHAEIQSYLDGDHGVDDMLEGHAEDVLHAAWSAAPVLTGEYQESLHIETDHTDRMVKRVVSDSDHAWVVEANTGNLSRALDSA